MVDMIQKSWQLTKSLYISGPHFTWARWKFLQIFFIFFNPFPTDIFSLHHSHHWCLFIIFTVHLLRNTQIYIKNNVCSRKQKGCTSLSMIFLSFGCRLSRIQNGREKREHKMATQCLFKSN